VSFGLHGLRTFPDLFHSELLFRHFVKFRAQWIVTLQRIIMQNYIMPWTGFGPTIWLIESSALFHAASAMIWRACSTNIFAAYGYGSAADQAPRRCIGPSAVYVDPLVGSGTRADFSLQRVRILRYTLAIAWSVEVIDKAYMTARDLSLLLSSATGHFNYWRRLGLNRSRF
jgi:hypothetical protein